LYLETTDSLGLCWRKSISIQLGGVHLVRLVESEPAFSGGVPLFEVDFASRYGKGTSTRREQSLGRASATTTTLASTRVVIARAKSKWVTTTVSVMGDGLALSSIGSGDKQIYSSMMVLESQLMRE
jgi:hypothetical protein